MQCWVLVQFFKEKKGTDRRKEKKKNSCQRQKSWYYETKNILDVSHCHWVFFSPSPLVKCLPNFKLNCGISHSVQVSLILSQGERLTAPSLSLLCVVGTFSITCIEVGCYYLFPCLSQVCDSAWYNLIHHGKVEDTARIWESDELE